MIATEADILTYLQLTSSASDVEKGFLSTIQPACEQAVKDFVGYSIEQATHTHFLPDVDRNVAAGGPLAWDTNAAGTKLVGTRSSRQSDGYLELPERPVRSVTTVHEDVGAYGGQQSGDFGASTLLTAGEDYWIDYTEAGFAMIGRLRRVGSWPSNARTVKVVYVAGYTVTELHTGRATAFLMAVLQTIKEEWARRGGTSARPVKAERLGKWAATYGGVDVAVQVPVQVQRMLTPYVKMGLYV
jgi:hypothetical protein